MHYRLQILHNDFFSETESTTLKEITIMEGVQTQWNKLDSISETTTYCVILSSLNSDDTSKHFTWASATDTQRIQISYMYIYGLCVHVCMYVCIHRCTCFKKALRKLFVSLFSAKVQTKLRFKKTKNKQLPRILPVFSNIKATCLHKLSKTNILLQNGIICQWWFSTNTSQKVSAIWQYLISHN